MSPELGKPGLLQPSLEQPASWRRRPADVFVPSWKQGVPAAFDITVMSPHRVDIVGQASFKPGAAAEAYEQFKRGDLDAVGQADGAAKGTGPHFNPPLSLHPPNALRHSAANP